MNIIVNSDSNEPSTDDVLDWLHYFGKTPTRLNDIYRFDRATVNISRTGAAHSLYSDDRNISSADLTAFWYRRGEISVGPARSYGRAFSAQPSSPRQGDMEQIMQAVYSVNSGYCTINKYADNDTNKLVNLNEALKAGLNVPNTIVTNYIDDLEEFLENNPVVILKPISQSFFEVLYDEGAFYVITPVTKLYGRDILDKIGGNKILKFLPTLFQEYIEKKYEIRSFFLNGDFYSMAIFSQSNEQTKVDFRNYDHANPNRCVPFELPDLIKQKLRALMQNINMNCGSFDIIVTPDLEFYFLEVNPIGQFQWLSKNCNYLIEKHIAETLCRTRS